MIEWGTVRSIRMICARCSPLAQGASGVTSVGAHHALVMFQSFAPAAIASLSPPPVPVGGLAGAVTGPRRKVWRSSASHSKPPVATITPRRAARAKGRPSFVPSIPPIRSPSLTSRCVSTPSTGSIPRSRHALSSRATIACPKPHCRAAMRCPSTSGGGIAVAPPSGVSRSISGLGSSMA